jgi:flavin-dependent dehydrogenase
MALQLARRGLSVVLLSMRRVTSLIGETAPPAIKQPLARLDLWDAFLAAGHRESPGIVTVWGSPRPVENDFLFNAYGPGWHLDRARFDSTLLASATAAGARLLEGLVWDCEHVAGRRWRLAFRGAQGASTVTARFVVDATGRSSLLARRLGSVCRADDRLVALVKFLPAVAVPETRTLIEACEGGWWYAAALPQAAAVLAYFADVDLVPRNGAGRQAAFDAQFAATSLVAGTFSNRTDVNVHCFSASSQRATPCAGSGWIAIGDAAAFFDPLSGQGLLKALTSAIRGADTVIAALDHPGFRDELVEESEVEYGRYLRLRAEHYSREQRWRSASFWRRRGDLSDRSRPQPAMAACGG